MTRALAIALFLPSLEGGGAERVFVDLANRFALWGRCVDMVLARADGPYLAALDPCIRVVDLAVRGKAGLVPALARHLRRDRPAALMSAMDAFNVAALTAGRLSGNGVPVVATCHLPVSGHAELSGRLRDRVMPWLARFAYPGAAATIAVSEGVADDLATSAGLPRSRIDVVMNPVDRARIRARAGEPLDHPWFAPGSPPVIVSIGQLARQKDFPTLLRAFARLDRPARLIILGEGPERPELEAMARELGVSGDVDMPGFVDNPFAYLARARLFALSSVWEGFGLVIVEALACGCPVVSTDCPSGPAEILANGEFGTLVPVGDAARLAAAIDEAIDRAPDAPALERRAAELCVDRVARLCRASAALGS